MKRLFCLLLALSLTLCACAGSPSAAPSGSEPSSATLGEAASGELQELDVVLDWYPNALHAFLYVAIDKGYFAEEGLKVNIRFPSNANDALSLVAAGRAQLGLYYQQDVILARANQDGSCQIDRGQSCKVR